MNKDFMHSIVFAKSADGTMYFGSVQFYQEEEPYWTPAKLLLFSAMRIDSDKPIMLSDLNKEKLNQDIRVKRIDEIYISNAKEIIEASDEAIDNIYDIVSLWNDHTGKRQGFSNLSFFIVMSIPLETFRGFFILTKTTQQKNPQINRGSKESKNG